MTSIETTLRSVRLELRVLKPAERDVSFIVVGAIALICLSDIGVAIFFRSKLITPSVASLRANPQDVAALGRWRKGVILSFAHAETVVLFGFVLKILGTRWNIAGLFFIVGILLFLVWTPKIEIPFQN